MFEFLVDCLSARHERDQQNPGSRLSGVISTPPGFHPEMRTVAPPGFRLSQESSDDAERLRGGALSCACCGGGGGSQPSLDPQPEVVQETSQMVQTAPRTPVNQTQQVTRPPPSPPSRNPPQAHKNPDSSSVVPPNGGDAGMSSVPPHTGAAPHLARPDHRSKSNLNLHPTEQQDLASTTSAGNGDGPPTPSTEVSAQRA